MGAIPSCRKAQKEGASHRVDLTDLARQMICTPHHGWTLSLSFACPSRATAFGDLMTSVLGLQPSRRSTSVGLDNFSQETLLLMEDWLLPSLSTTPFQGRECGFCA